MQINDYLKTWRIDIRYAARVGETARVHRGHRPHARRGHRRDDDDLQRRECAARSTPALLETGSAHEGLAGRAGRRPAQSAGRPGVVLSEVHRPTRCAARLLQPVALHATRLHDHQRRRRADSRRDRRRDVLAHARLDSDSRARLRLERGRTPRCRSPGDHLLCTVAGKVQRRSWNRRNDCGHRSESVHRDRRWPRGVPRPHRTCRSVRADHHTARRRAEPGADALVLSCRATPARHRRRSCSLRGRRAGRASESRFRIRGLATTKAPRAVRSTTRAPLVRRSLFVLFGAVGLFCLACASMRIFARSRQRAASRLPFGSRSVPVARLLLAEACFSR